MRDDLPASFTAAVRQAQARDGYRQPVAFGLGLARFSPVIDPTVAPVLLDVWYPHVNLHEAAGSAALFCAAAGHTSGSGSYRLQYEHLADLLRSFEPLLPTVEAHPNFRALLDLQAAAAYEAPPPLASVQVLLTCIEDLQAAPSSPAEVYLRLHLLSHRKLQPHGCSLEGAFGLLTNVAWTDRGPIEAGQLNAARAQLRGRGEDLRVVSVDKFPRMVDYVVPSGVRIADADRVRLGAHLAAGTTVMHEGFVNFNAGTLGTSMVEGRISAGVVVGDGSDVGGGASIMGTLSGGGKEVISIGRDCLLGANSGLGISLGDRCTLEAGLYLTAASKVTLLADGRQVKARELSGLSDLLFRRNSLNGGIEVLAKSADFGGLSAALHAND